MKKNTKGIRKLMCLIIFFGLKIVCAQNYHITINTIISPPANPYIVDAFGKAANGINVSIRNDTASNLSIKLLGKLERISPAPFSVNFKIGSYSNAPTILINPFGTRFASPSELTAAFGGFYIGLLDISGLTSISDIMEGNRIKLPPGQYRICFYALSSLFQPPQIVYLSNKDLGCAMFTVCKADPPQFTYPVSNLVVSSNFATVQPTSPVNFAWTPPLSTCGSPGPINYELEIREILNNQTVTDAINNPFVFRKTAIPSTSFLLDLNLYQNVLQRGKKYAIRVRAASINAISPIVMENNGYSRVEAFQFGSENGPPPAQSYYIPLDKRKSNFWDDYQIRKGRDTLVPIAEYIAYKLMEAGVVYNTDAIELLVSLNPDLKDKKVVSLYQPLNLPVFPEVPADLRKDFEIAHTANLKSNSEEVILFKKYLDSLKNINHAKIPDRFGPEFTDLVAYLDKFSPQASLLNSISLGFMNSMLSELVFDLRKTSAASEYNHLHNITSDLKALATIPSSTSLLNKDFFRKGYSLSFSKVSTPGTYSLLASLPYYSGEVIKEKYSENFYATTDQLIPLDVVVYRPVQPPANPILNAPDLKGVYRIFYTPGNLYNNRNPEINAKSPGRLASTTQVSLPRKLEYKFWTLNMLNHKTTLPQVVDIDEVFLNNQKKDLKGKKKTIILKVE